MNKNDIIIKHYNKLINKYGISKAGLGWKSNKQNQRFSMFLKHLNFLNKKVFDFGCGKSDFLNFLIKKKQKPKVYLCSEINPLLINHLKKKFYKKHYVKIIHKDIVAKKINFNVNISISNGVHNFKYKENDFFFIKDIKYLFSKSTEAVALSFLNNQVDFKENHLKYHNLDKTIKSLKKISNNIIIDHTFSRFETFVTIFK